MRSFFKRETSLCRLASSRFGAFAILRRRSASVEPTLSLVVVVGLHQRRHPLFSLVPDLVQLVEEVLDEGLCQPAVVLEPELVREFIGCLRHPEHLLVDEQVLRFAGAQVAQVSEALGQVQPRELADGLEVVDRPRGVRVVCEVLVLGDPPVPLWSSAAS